ncbi:hypothetical protein CWE12_08455 [Aliidiomarina sedimenti]|uniref:Conjugal transfer protein TraF n=1 Tax=Aliidiomarina sedimenti TaxID=1933879 RepID=A0ABY0BZ89_9GAMM|nr:conjugal transfer protein TraF [Aliidiomarina sedimenti]RUO29982.1 hypothetical protein CWE12_08455 [Aliidiomarina sedimenti]
MLFTRSTLASLIGLALIASPALANDNRSHAMGGSGVANGKYFHSGSLNPALAANFEERDHFGLILPAAYFEAADQDQLTDRIDDFQDSFDQLEWLLEQADMGVPVNEQQVEQARGQLADDFTNIRGTVIADVGVHASASIPNRFAAASFFINTDLSAFTSAKPDENDIERILNAQSDNELNNLTSEGYVVGRLITDFGVALARDFNLFGRNLTFGVAPKVQQIESFTYFSALSDIDTDDFDADEYRSSSSAVNVDLGMTMDLSERMSFGVSVQNLLSQEVDGQPIYSRQLNDLVSLDYEIKPHAVAGLGYNTRRMSLSLDLDLTKQNYLGLSPASQLQVFGESRETQFVRAGYEYDLARWIQVRLGYRHDLQDSYESAITAGLGFSPFGRMHINLSAMYADDRNLGAGVQLGFTF